MVFYHCVNVDDSAYHRLFNDEEYKDFFENLKNGYFSLDFFRAFCKDPAYAEMIPGYIGDAAVGMYRRWQGNLETSGRPTLDELADQTAKILLDGLKAI